MPTGAVLRAAPALAALFAAVLAGCGGPEKGALGDFSPAASPALPQLQSSGGPVVAQPKVLPIACADDAASAGIESFLHAMAASSWAQTTSEYGVGPLTVLPTVVLPGPAPAMITEGELEQILAESTGGASPAWGPADASTIYLFLTPPGTTVTGTSVPGTSCTDFDGFHGEAVAGGGLRVPFVVDCACPGFDGPFIDDLQERTIAISHELVEAATDPFPDSDPAYDATDGPDAVWTLVTGGEVADLCQFDLDPYALLPGTAHVIQRSWSNATAAAGGNPCVPDDTGEPSFGAVAALPDSIDVAGTPVQGVRIPVGGSASLSVTLWSAAPTSGPWTVTAVDGRQLNGEKPNLALSLDEVSGQNGDTLNLTITVLGADAAWGVEPFVLVSDLDGRSTLWMGAVGQ